MKRQPQLTMRPTHLITYNHTEYRANIENPPKFQIEISNYRYFLDGVECHKVNGELVKGKKPLPPDGPIANSYDEVRRAFAAAYTNTGGFGGFTAWPYWRGY